MQPIRIRKLLTTLVATVVLTTSIAAANAADATFQAILFGQRGDQDATGRALFSMDPKTGDAALVIRVINVSTSTRADVMVDGQFVGTIQIIAETGQLLLQSTAGEGDFPLVRPGSTIELVRSEDGVQLLFGVFRRAVGHLMF